MKTRIELIVIQYKLATLVCELNQHLTKNPNLKGIAFKHNVLSEIYELNTLIKNI